MTYKKKDPTTLLPPGRPKVPENERKGVSVSVRFTKAEVDQLTQGFPTLRNGIRYAVRKLLEGGSGDGEGAQDSLLGEIKGKLDELIKMRQK